MRPTIDYRIPKRNNCYLDLHEAFVFCTSVLIDKRLFKSCIRYSGDGGGGGNDGLNKRISIEENSFFFYRFTEMVAYVVD